MSWKILIQNHNAKMMLRDHEKQLGSAMQTIWPPIPGNAWWRCIACRCGILMVGGLTRQNTIRQFVSTSPIHRLANWQSELCPRLVQVFSAIPPHPALNSLSLSIFGNSTPPSTVCLSIFRTPVPPCPKHTSVFGARNYKIVPGEYSSIDLVVQMYFQLVLFHTKALSSR